MTFDRPLRPPSTAPSCRYGSSRLRFRGPARPLEGRHIAFVGGSETLGRSLARAYPDLVEEALGEVCVNLGQVNASIDVALQDTLIANACRDAALTVMSVTGAANLTNRLYSVHPRRNDRFLRPADPLRLQFPEVDFADICFTRHLLMRLWETDPVRFAAVRTELQAAWSARMRSFIDRIGPDVILLWFAPHSAPSEAELVDTTPQGPDPLFVTQEMLAELRPLVRDVVFVPPCPPSNEHEPLGMTAHRMAADALLPPVRAALELRSWWRPGRHQDARPEDVSVPDHLWHHPEPSPAGTAQLVDGRSPSGPALPWQLDLNEDKAPALRRVAIAVLPFSIAAATEEELALADHLTEDVTADLLGLDDLTVKVPPATTIEQLTLTALDRLRDLDGCDLLLGGTLRIAKGQVRCCVRLLDLERRSYLWIEAFDRAFDRSVRGWEELARDVAGAVVEVMHRPPPASHTSWSAALSRSALSLSV